jgi:hypothetical protein
MVVAELGSLIDVFAEDDFQCCDLSFDATR